jgi:hypothetical protein
VLLPRATTGAHQNAPDAKPAQSGTWRARSEDGRQGWKNKNRRDIRRSAHEQESTGLCVWNCVPAGAKPYCWSERKAGDCFVARSASTMALFARALERH